MGYVRVRRGDAAAVREIRELLVELPASARAETLSLVLGDAELMVPAAGAGAFHALTDLLLSQVRIEPGSADESNLGRMLSSSCCPRLRRLHLEHIASLTALRFDAAGTLEEIRLVHLDHMSVLEVDAPGLRSLHMLDCNKMSTVRISAPGLEVLGCDCGMPELVEFIGTASVRRLEKLHLLSHGFPQGHLVPAYSNRGNAWLLERCTAAENLDVAIWAPDPHTENHGGTAELMSLVPRFPAVTDLSINVWVTLCDGPGHRLGHSAARLVARCSNLERLSIAFYNQFYDPCSHPGCFCLPPAGEEEEMKSGDHGRLEQLVEAKIAGFRPLPDQMSLVRVLVAMAPALEKMTVQFEWSSEDDGVLPLPCDRGHWARVAAASRDDRRAYEWTPAAAP